MNKRRFQKVISVILICLTISTLFTGCNEKKKYGGHGFKYMHGFSSTDFSDYMVYSENSKLVPVEVGKSLLIENEEDMPVLDGAEACYPLYAAFAKATYKDIDVIEENYLKESDNLPFNGKIVTFTNSVFGFNRLLSDDEEKYGDRIDMFFGARPSVKQMWMAKEAGIEVEVTPIGKEAFVFFVEENNPIDNISSEDIKKIYHGDITNWKELGGKNQKVLPFQRPEDSGSQTVMQYFMGDTPLMEPKTYQVIDPMMGVVNKVSQFHSEKGAIGYSFRYFVEELIQEKDVKILSVDGVYPSLENIENGTYPCTTDLCVITRKDETNPYVKEMIDFILSKEGQEIIHKTGYGCLTE